MRRALELDPEYALAWAGLADGYSLHGYYGMLAPEAAAQPAREAAAKALHLGPNLAESHNAAAQIALLFDWDWATTERSFLRALAINPAYVQAEAWYGLFYLGFVCGEWQRAIARTRALQEAERLSAYATAILSFGCSWGGRPAEGVEWATRACELDPESFIAMWSLQTAQYYSASYEASISTGDTVLAASGRHPWSLLFMALALVAEGDVTSARAIAVEMEARVTRGHLSPFHRGIVAATIGDQGAANTLLLEALHRRDPAIPVFVRFVVSLPAVRELPACQEILNALRLPGLS